MTALIRWSRRGTPSWLRFREADTAVRMGRGPGLSDGETVHVRPGALLHDTGKISISNCILLKSGPP